MKRGALLAVTLGLSVGPLTLVAVWQVFVVVLLSRTVARLLALFF